MFPTPGPRLNPKLFDRRIRMALGLSVDEPKVYYTPIPQGKGRFGAGAGGGAEDAYINQLLVSALFKSVQSKKAIKAFHDALSDHYLLRIIKNAIYQDVLYKFIDPNETQIGLPIIIKCSSKKCEERIIRELEELRVPEIVREILDATLYLGEYLLFFDEENYQIDETLIDQTAWRAVYQRGRLSRIVTFSNSERIEALKDRALIFRVKYLPLKLNVLGQDDYPFYAYVGQGIIGPEILNLIQTIRLIEALMPINQVLSVQAGQIVYARFPEAPANIKEGFDLARQYERLLNAPVEVSTSTDPTSYQDIIASVAKWRVIPLFGEKGVIEPRELPRPGPIDMQALAYIKQALADAIPLPAAYLGVAEQNQDRNKLAQYYMMITEIRRAIAEFVEEVIAMAIAGKKGVSGEYSVSPISVSGILENQMGDYFDLAAFVMDAITRTVLSLVDMRERGGDWLNIGVLSQTVNRIFSPLTGGEPLILENSLLSQEEEEEEELGLGLEEEPTEEVPLEGEEAGSEEASEEEAPEETEGEKEEAPPEEEKGKKQPTKLDPSLLDNLF